MWGKQRGCFSIDTAGLQWLPLGKTPTPPALLAQAQQRHAEHVVPGAAWRCGTNAEPPDLPGRPRVCAAHAGRRRAAGHRPWRQAWTKGENNSSGSTQAQRQRQRPRTPGLVAEAQPHARRRCYARVHPEGGQTDDGAGAGAGSDGGAVSQLVAKAETGAGCRCCCSRCSVLNVAPQADCLSLGALLHHLGPLPPSAACHNGTCRNSFGPCALLLGRARRKPSSALGEALLQHAHQGDGAALADVAAGAPNWSWLADLKRLAQPGRQLGVFQPVAP